MADPTPPPKPKAPETETGRPPLVEVARQAYLDDQAQVKAHAAAEKKE